MSGSTEENKENKLAIVEKDDLSLVEHNNLNAKQLDIILKKTPAQYLKKRPAKGGGEWTYVTGGCLNINKDLLLEIFFTGP